MIDPYRMVFVNVIASSVVLLGSVIYKYVYPRKKINLFVLLLIISILPIISIFRPGDYESGDFNIHIYRIMSFYDSLSEGNLMPSWAAELNATYGNPLFIFNYSLPYYFISFFHFLGIGFIDSMKIYLGLTLYLSGVFMFSWIKELTNNKLAAFTSAIFYVFSPYHLIDVHFRATLGESTIFMLIPLLFLFISKYTRTHKNICLIWVILVTDLLFLAHPLLGSVFFGITALYVLFGFFRERDGKTASLQLLSLFAGFISSIYIWSTFLIYSPYMFKILPSTLNSTVPQAFFENLFFSPWRFGLLFQGPNGELAHVIGYTQVFILIISIIMIITKKIPKKIRFNYIFWMSLCILTLFIMTPLSNNFWGVLNRINSMLVLFGRLSLAISFFTSIIAGYFVITLTKDKQKIWLTYILIVLTIGFTILNWGHRRVIPEINDTLLRRGVWKSTISEGTTAYFLNNRWADINNFWFSKVPDYHLEIIQGKGNLKEIKRTSTHHYYLVNAQTPLTIKENTLYFPGWNLKSNFNNISIFPGDRGIINAKFPKGQQFIELSYTDLPLYALVKVISGLCFLILISIIILYYFFLFWQYITSHRVNARTK